MQNYRENGLQEYLYTGLHCEYCIEERKYRWGAEWKRQKALYESRQLELRSMPYNDYLQTPEWQATRERKLKSVGHSCELCSAKGVELHVHHRTYARRGAELDQDLTAACLSSGPT
jgi:5-methylcytosine-specific restriction endonuclease McrA